MITLTDDSETETKTSCETLQEVPKFNSEWAVINIGALGNADGWIPSDVTFARFSQFIKKNFKFKFLLANSFTKFTVIKDILFVSIGSTEKAWIPSDIDLYKEKKRLMMTPGVCDNFRYVIVLPSVFKIFCEDDELIFDSSEFANATGWLGERFFNEYRDRIYILMGMLDSDKELFKKIIVK